MNTTGNCYQKSTAVKLKRKKMLMNKLVTFRVGKKCPCRKFIFINIEAFFDS